MSINNKAVCVREDSEWKRCKVRLGYHIAGVCWTIKEQEGYTVPDFVHQVETAWKELNNIS